MKNLAYEVWEGIKGTGHGPYSFKGNVYVKDLGDDLKNLYCAQTKSYDKLLHVDHYVKRNEDYDFGKVA